MARSRIGYIRCATVLAAGVAITLAGCGAGSGGPAQTRTPTTTTTKSATSTTKPATSTTTTKSTPKPTATTTAAAGDRCTTANLKITLGTGEGGGTAGTYYKPLQFTNTGPAPCTLRGFPGVSYVAGGSQVGPAAFREGDNGSEVTLAPGETAHATVGFVQVHNYDAAACQPTPVTGLRVYPPGETASTVVAYQGTGCASDDIPGHQLTVRAVKPGNTGA